MTQGAGIFVDVTASRQAVGQHATGVIRVERELAPRAQAYLGQGVSFVAYDQTRNDFFHVSGVDGDPTLGELSTSAVHFGSQARLLSFGLECNTKDYRQMVRDARGGRYQLYSVLYDLTAALNPQLSVENYGEFLRGFFSDMVWGVSKFLAISEHTRRQLAMFCEQDSLPMPRCDVFPLGSDAVGNHDDSTADVGDLSARLGGRSFALYVSTIEARKNHYCLYRAWDRAVREKRVDPAKHCLVFAGRRGWGVQDLIEQITTNPETKDSIIFVESAKDEVLSRLYRESLFFLFPSHDEGYGLPLAEALSAGKFCLSSDRGALPEVGGDVVEYIDPLDVLKWSDRIGQLFRNPSLALAEERNVRQRFRRTSWDDSAAAFYRLVAEGA